MARGALTLLGLQALLALPHAAAFTASTMRSRPAHAKPGVPALRMAADAPPLKKVVVTGTGMVTPVATGSDETFEALLEGKSGIVRLPEWADELPATNGGLCSSFNAKDWVDRREAKRQGRYSHFALACAKMAIEEAKLDPAAIDLDRAGVIVGSGIGGVEWFESNSRAFYNKGGGQAGLKNVSPFLIPALIGDTASGVIAINYGFKGPNYGVVSACATGTHALGTALKYMQTGQADVMLAGGSEACMTPLCFAGFCALRAMTTDRNEDPEKASRPYDATRSGFVMAEGCGVLLLETEEHAKARGAPILCELAGYAATGDAYHITAPHPEGAGLAACMRDALADAGVAPEDVGYINAHGTSTQLNDKLETMAIKTVFGDHAANLKISSVKSMIGHSLGAAGGIEAAVCAKVFKEGWIPPTINYENPDPECDLDITPNTKFQFDEIPKAVLSDNLGFGGHNAAAVFKRYDG